MTRTRRFLGLLAVTGLAVAVVPLTALGDVTIEPAEFVERTPAGTLVLATGDDTLTLTHRDAGGVLVREETQVLRKKDGCAVDNATFDGLLSFDLTGGSGLGVGLVSNGLGSRESDNCSTGNGRVELGQGLQLTLELPGGVVADMAVLDVEGKFGADLSAQGTLFGEDSLDAPGDLATGSDNGADAGGLDNTDVTIGTTDPSDDFDVLTLSVVSDDGRGAIALEGGGDHDTPDGYRTVFDLVHRTDFEYALGCGDTRTSADDDVDFGDIDSGATAYTVNRYDTDDDAEGEPCAPIGADLSSDGDGVLFRKTTTDIDGHEQDPTIRLTLTWKVDLYEADDETLRPLADVEDELAREIDLLESENPNFVDVQYCLANNDTEAGPAPADRPDGVPWCLLDETIEVVDGYLVQIHVYDGWGDPRWL